MTVIVKIHEAKTNLSKLIARVEAGEEIVIARGDTPVAKLVAAEPQKKRPQFGALKGKLPKIPGSFFFDPVSGLAEDAPAYRDDAAQETARITTDSEVCHGAPCIRGLRIRVSDVLGMLAAGMSRDEILADYPYLETGDIDAALAYGAGASAHRVIRVS